MRREMTGPASLDGRVRHTLPMGGVFTSREPAVIKTILGSCVAVGLIDPARKIGGLNHFMLPSRLDQDGDYRNTCYGVYAMDLLMNEMMKLGAERERLRAKVFGAAHLLGFRKGRESVPQSNSDFILSYLERERIPLLGQDLGGELARTIYFFTDTGRVLLKRLTSTVMSRRIEAEEQTYGRKVTRTMEQPADVTLFEEP